MRDLAHRGAPIPAVRLFMSGGPPQRETLGEHQSPACDRKRNRNAALLDQARGDHRGYGSGPGRRDWDHSERDESYAHGAGRRDGPARWWSWWWSWWRRKPGRRAQRWRAQRRRPQRWWSHGRRAPRQLPRSKLPRVAWLQP